MLNLVDFKWDCICVDFYVSHTIDSDILFINIYSTLNVYILKIIILNFNISELFF